MGIVGRIVQPGVVVTLHTAPGMSGELARSERLAGAILSEGNRYVTNLSRITLQANADGQARYFGVWIEGYLEATGKLSKVLVIARDSEPFFLPGQLRLRMAT